MVNNVILIPYINIVVITRDLSNAFLIKTHWHCLPLILMVRPTNKKLYLTYVIESHLENNRITVTTDKRQDLYEEELALSHNVNNIS